MWDLDALEPITLRLLERLVEAGRSVPAEERDYFSFIPLMQASMVDGNGTRLQVRDEDLDILNSCGFTQIIKYHGDGHGYNFFVTPSGTKAYREIHDAAQEATENVEGEMRDYLAAAAFRANYPESYERWSEVSEILWKAETDTDYSMIGHKCRELMHVFISELIVRESVTGADPDVAKTVSRLRTVLETKRDERGKSKRAFLDALLAYWGTVADLVQRQEHAGQREGEPLNWEDARRVVFHTAVVMFEIDRTI